jgi:Domain of unknown function (DUF4253)
MSELESNRLSETEEDMNDELEEDEPGERWGEEVDPPDFSERGATPAYLQAVQDLAEICGNEAMLLEEVVGGFYLNVLPLKFAEIQIEDLQNDFLPRGCFVFISDDNAYEPSHCLTILPTTDKYEAIAALGFNAANYDIGTGYIIQWLQELEAEQPFILTSIHIDLLSGRFLSAVKNPETLAERMYEFCPDLVDQGVESVEELAESLRTSDLLYFWWD